MNLKELKELIELLSEKDFTEFEIERQGFRMRISRSRGEATPAVAPAAAPVIVPSPLPIPFGLSSAQEASRPEVAATPVTAASPPAAATAEEAASEPALHTIKSPMPGTFYRSPSPTSDTFVKIGDHVEPETVVCIVEAMKLMNPIQAEVTGEIVKIYVENGQPVEYGQPLFGIKA